MCDTHGCSIVFDVGLDRCWSKGGAGGGGGVLSSYTPDNELCHCSLLQPETRHDRLTHICAPILPDSRHG
jgi:hypothetical protein